MPDELECKNCGSRMTDAALIAARASNPPILSCCPERKMQPAVLNKFEAICDEIFERWDKDMRSGKLLTALGGRLAGYRPDVTEVRRALGAIR